MKKLITLMTILISTLSFATNFSLEEKAELNTLKITLEAQQVQFEVAIEQLEDIQAQYESTTLFQVEKRVKLKKTSCGVVKATTGVQLMFLATALEQSKQALEKIDFEQSDLDLFKSNLNGFIANSVKASDNCRKFRKSIDALTLSSEQLEEATAILSSYIPEMF